MNYNDTYVQQDMSLLNDEKFIDQIKQGDHILITGCNGMIATYLIYAFLYLNDKYQKQLKIYGTTRNMDKTKRKFADIYDRNDVIFIENDVTEPLHLEDKIDYIYHLASSADPKNILNHPVDIIKANTLGLINILEFARNRNVQRVIFSSTREVYGKMEENCSEVTEESIGIINQLSTRACYPESKKIGETLLKSYQLQYGVPYTILRIAHSYGPGMPICNDGRIMSDLIYNVVNNEDIVLKSDGSAIRGFCYLIDLISGMLYATYLGKENQVYNIANEEENISILNLSKLLIELFQEKNLHLTYQEASREEKQAYCAFKRVVMNTDKIREIGWKPKVKLKQGLKNTVNSFRNE